MAVVQISKIQVRRGRKNSESGIPQLSSGELAWTVDTQELFIGNGSVADGAPYVGNSKVLTEHDNLLDLIESYRFARPDPGITKSVFRSLQNKLDDYVNVKDFGAVGDGISDDTQPFQNALDDLFTNPNGEYRKRLFLPTGHYLINGTLKIPSNTLIDGESQVGCILIVNSSTLETKSSNGTLKEEFESFDRSEKIVITNLTFKFTTGHLDLTGLRDSTFQNVSFQGPYDADGISEVEAATPEDPLILMTNGINEGIKIDNIIFNSCRFEGAYRAIGFEQINPFESNIKIVDSTFIRLNNGIYISGIVGQRNCWNVIDSRFEEIAFAAFESTNGTRTRFSRCRFKNCGNGSNQADAPVTSIIIFGQYKDNVVDNSSFNRQQEAFTVVSVDDDRIAYPEVLNSARTEITDQINSLLFVSASFTPLAMFSSLNKKTMLDYTVSFSNGASRSGIITISIGDSLTGPILTDNYSSTCGYSDAEQLEFRIDVVDRGPEIPGSETMILSYSHPTAGVTPDSIDYIVTYGV